MPPKRVRANNNDASEPVLKRSTRGASKEVENHEDAIAPAKKEVAKGRAAQKVEEKLNHIDEVEKQDQNEVDSEDEFVSKSKGGKAKPKKGAKLKAPKQKDVQSEGSHSEDEAGKESEVESQDEAAKAKPKSRGRQAKSKTKKGKMTTPLLSTVDEELGNQQMMEINEEQKLNDNKASETEMPQEFEAGNSKGPESDNAKVKPSTRGKTGRSKAEKPNVERVGRGRAAKSKATMRIHENYDNENLNPKIEDGPVIKPTKTRVTKQDPKPDEEPAQLEASGEDSNIQEETTDAPIAKKPKSKATAKKTKDEELDQYEAPGEDSNAQDEVTDAPPAKKPKSKGTTKKKSKDDDEPKPSTSKAAQSKREKIPDVSKLDFSNKSKSPKGTAWNIKLASWNLNGLRAWLEKDGLSYLDHEDPDVLCVQETKCSDDKLPDEVRDIEGYHCHWLSGDREGYSGVGLISKNEPISIKYGIGIEQHDNEGRVITAEYEKFYLVATYVPNAGRGLVRLDYRQDWDKDFRKYLKKLDAKKPVILTGDLNVAHQEIDLANPKTNQKTAGFTPEERQGFTQLLGEGFIDSFRHLYPNETGAYSYWTYMRNARAKNVGWRLDYFVLSERLSNNLCDSVIRKDVMGSDHCPVVLFLHI